MAKIKELGKDALIVHIGDFFRYTNLPDWRVTLWCYPIQNKKHTRLSNLPLLSRGKLLNNTKAETRRVDRIISLIPGYSLTTSTLKEFPDLGTHKSVIDKESNQTSFCFQSENGDTVVLPQLELARSIFLINSYLCRSCLDSATLQLEFDVQRHPVKNHVDIHVLTTNTFPKSAFDQSGTKKLLAWLLTNPSAMASYLSIYQHYLLNRELKDNIETWRFSFEPPPMTNWKFHARGRYSKDKKKYLVEEIIGIEADIDIPRSIAFINPAFVKKELSDESARPGSSGMNWQANGDEFEIDDDESASAQNESLVLEGDHSWISFTKPFDVYKQEQVKNSSKLIINERSDSEAGKDVSTGEPHQGGNLPAADVGGKQDITNQEKQFASRFKSFDHMLKVLVVKHKCLIRHQETLPLPKVGRSKQHQLENGTPRAIKAARIEYKNTEVMLLEVDTSDGIKMLSTKLIFMQNQHDWIENFSQIRKGVVAKSIAWPNDLLDELFGERNHLGINHPKHQGSEAGNLPIESIESWAFRFVQALPK